MVGHGGSSAGSYLADLTSPIPSHCASVVVTSTLSFCLLCELHYTSTYCIMKKGMDKFMLHSISRWSSSPACHGKNHEIKFLFLLRHMSITQKVAIVACWYLKGEEIYVWTVEHTIIDNLLCSSPIIDATSCHRELSTLRNLKIF